MNDTPQTTSRNLKNRAFGGANHGGGIAAELAAAQAEIARLSNENVQLRAAMNESVLMDIFGEGTEQ